MIKITRVQLHFESCPTLITYFYPFSPLLLYLYRIDPSSSKYPPTTNISSETTQVATLHSTSVLATSTQYINEKTPEQPVQTMYKHTNAEKYEVQQSYEVEYSSTESNEDNRKTIEGRRDSTISTESKRVNWPLYNFVQFDQNEQSSEIDQTQ